MGPIADKITVVLLAFGFWILSSSASSAKEDNIEVLNQQIVKLVEEGKYQEAIPLAEKVVELARRVRGPEDPDTASSINNLALLYSQIGEYAKAEPLYKEALRIYQKLLGPEH